ncbi:MAG: hypothetical protein FWD16_01880 [Clostridia bacterium]|nr:hypothetical protein [Clostridia bacterium]
MSEQNIPKMEKKLQESLSGDMLQNALGFVAYLRDIGMTTNEDEEGNRFYYKGETMSIIICWKDDANPNGLWFICDAPFNDCEGYRVGEDLKEFVWSNVKTCNVFEGNPCGCGSEPGKSITTFGKQCEHVCTSELQFFNPDAEALVNVKKLMDLWIYKVDNIAGYSSQDR